MRIETIQRGGKPYALVNVASIRDAATKAYVERNGIKVFCGGGNWRRMTWAAWQRRPGVKGAKKRGVYRLRPSQTRENMAALAEEGLA